MKKKSLIFNTVVLLLAGLGFLYMYAPRFITEINNPIMHLFREKTEPKVNKLPSDYKLFDFQTHDNLTIKGYIKLSETDTILGTVILLHGIRGTKEYFIELSKRLSKKGYQTVAIDLRAHGESEGVHCTFGYHEKKDVSLLLDYLSEVEGVRGGVGIWGQSLGGAIALQTLAVDKRLEFGIVESTFSDLEIVVNDYSRFHLGFAIRPLSNFLLFRSGEIADYTPSEVKPEMAAGEIRQPILMTHGGKDQRIDIQYGKRNFSRLHSFQKEFYEIPDARHLDVWEKGGEEYFEKVFMFIEEAIER